MAKKSSASQSRSKTTKKKTSSSRATSAKKKTTTRQRATTRKKTTAKKTSRKKSTAKKKTSRAKTSTKKKAATKPAPKKKTTAAKSTSKKKTTAKKAPPAKKTKSGSKASSNGDATTAKESSKATLGAAQEAARRLAAAAGLVPLKDRSTTAEEKLTKARKVKRSPLKPAQLEEFRQILLLKRAEVLSDVTDMENEALGGRSGALSSFPQHLADQGSDEYDQSLALGLAASQRKLLGEIDAALDRIENGTFGICEVLGIPISRQRLEAQPWTRVSLEGARQQDSYTSR